MNRLKINVAIFVLDMCKMQVEHYTKVINSCETLEQLNTTSGWLLNGFKKLYSAIENLPRRRQKLCLSALDAAKYFVFSVSRSKGFELFWKETEGKITPECSESETGEKIGSIFEGLAEVFPGSVCCKVTVERRKAAAVDPAKEPPVPKEPEREPTPESSGGGQEDVERTA